jgi:hypothetical protein
MLDSAKKRLALIEHLLGALAVADELGDRDRLPAGNYWRTHCP